MNDGVHWEAVKIGGAILEIDHPSVVKYRCENYLLTPEEWLRSADL